MTQTEIARSVGAAGPSAVAQWERGTTVPDGIRRERLVELLEGRRWPELRAAAIAGHGLPGSWERSGRWYRRASRERPMRETVGGVVAAILGDLQAVTSTASLRRSYCEHDGDWAGTIAERCGRGGQGRPELRRLEDAAYALRWVELARDVRLDPCRSLVHQLPVSFVGDTSTGPAVPVRSRRADLLKGGA
ncbi:MAG: hypothetical protein GEU75_08235 [Dehalococcoidia bacterium]|nr:hypothetical protein [Dehalococcoidia bacterium]